MKRTKLIILPKLIDRGGDISKQWCITFSVRDPRSGDMERKRISKGLSIYKDPEARRSAAEKIMTDLEKKLKNGWNPASDDSTTIYSDQLKYENLAKKEGAARAGDKTFNFFMNKYLEERRPSIALSSYQTYQSKFRIFEQFLQKAKQDGNDISCFDNKTARNFIEFLFNKRKVHNKMVNEYITLMRTFYKWLIRNEFLFYNPFANLDKYKTACKTARYFQPALLEAVKQTIIANDAQLWTAVQFIFYCSVRPAELIKLKIKDIDMYGGLITIPAAISKNRKLSTVILPDTFLEYLKTLDLQKYPDNFYIISKKGVPDKDHVSKNYLWKHFDAIRIKMDLPREYTIYSFKHTAAVMAVRRGLNIKDIQLQNRHYSLDMTDKYLRQMLETESEGIRNNFPVF